MKIQRSQPPAPSNSAGKPSIIGRAVKPASVPAARRAIVDAFEDAPAAVKPASLPTARGGVVDAFEGKRAAPVEPSRASTRSTTPQGFGLSTSPSSKPNAPSLDAGTAAQGGDGGVTVTRVPADDWSDPANMPAGLQERWREGQRAAARDINEARADQLLSAREGTGFLAGAWAQEGAAAANAALSGALDEGSVRDNLQAGVGPALDPDVEGVLAAEGAQEGLGGIASEVGAAVAGASGGSGTWTEGSGSTDGASGSSGSSDTDDSTSSTDSAESTQQTESTDEAPDSGSGDGFTNDVGSDGFPSWWGNPHIHAPGGGSGDSMELGDGGGGDPGPDDEGGTSPGHRGSGGGGGPSNDPGNGDSAKVTTGPYTGDFGEVINIWTNNASPADKANVGGYTPPDIDAQGTTGGG